MEEKSKKFQNYLLLKSDYIKYKEGNLGNSGGKGYKFDLEKDLLLNIIYSFFKNFKYLSQKSLCKAHFSSMEYLK